MAEIGIIEVQPVGQADIGIIELQPVGQADMTAMSAVWEMNPILAEIISILTARIDALEEQITGNLGDIEVNNLTINQGLNIHGSEGNNVLTGTTAPAVIPDHIWQGYVNTANGDLYISKNNTAVIDWVKIN